MSKLHFLNPVDLSIVRALAKRVGIIPSFAMERSINLLWAPAGNGKTSFCFALANAFCQKGMEVAYIDVDNGLDILQDREYDKIIEKIGKQLKYINADYLDNPNIEIPEMLECIRRHAKKGEYDGCVFFLDSLKFFLNGGTYDEGKINKLVEFCKTIRRCGGSVWILNHALKNGSDMKGAQSLTDAVDEQWEMIGLGVEEKESHYVLKPKKKRMKVLEVGFSVDNETLQMRTLDPVIASMSTQEREFVEKVKVALEKQIHNQNALLKELELDHGDRFGRESLAKYAGRFWRINQVGTKKLYEKLDTVDTPTQ